MGPDTTMFRVEHLAAGQRATESWYPLVALRDVVDGLQDRHPADRAAILAALDA